MVSDHRARVDELLADYRRSREQLADTQRALAAVSGSAGSQDGLVTATVGATGGLTGLTIAEDAYRRLRPAELAGLVVRTAQAAAAEAAKAAQAVVSPVLPAGTDPAALLGGTADLTPAEIAPQPSGRARHGAADDENFEDLTWMQDPGRRA